MEKPQLSDFAAISAGADRSAAQSGLKQQPFSDAVLMCAKCCRKLDAGKTLRQAVKAAIRIAYADAVQLEKVDCFSLCPKGGQVLATVAGQSRAIGHCPAQFKYCNGSRVFVTKSGVIIALILYARRKKPGCGVRRGYRPSNSR